MKKRLNDASADEWTRASIKWSTNLNSHVETKPEETISFEQYIEEERDRYLKGLDAILAEEYEDWVDDVVGCQGDSFDDHLSAEVRDNVNNPDHYNHGGIECIDYIKQQLGDCFVEYCEGNVHKYLHRWRYKNGLEDLRKAQWYLNQMIVKVEELGE